MESSASAVTGNEGLFADAGLALGRSFRVGWGPGGKLIHLGALCGPYTAKYVPLYWFVRVCNVHTQDDNSEQFCCS